MQRFIWPAFLAAIPVVMGLVIAYQNVLPFGKEQVFIIDIGAMNDASGVATLSVHPERVSPRQSIEGVTYREITSDLVYLRVTSEEARRATKVSATAKFRPVLPKNPSLDLGVKHGEGSNWAFENLYDPFLGKVSQLPLVTDDRYKVHATDAKYAQRFSTLESFFSSLRPGQSVAAERPADVQSLLPKAGSFRPNTAFAVDAPEAPLDPYWQTRSLLRQVSTLPRVLGDKYSVFATDIPPLGLPATFDEFLATRLPGTVLASDSPSAVSALLPPTVDKRPQSFYGDTKALAREQPKDPYTQLRPLLQRVATMPQVLRDQFSVFSTDPASTQKANSFQAFLSGLLPGAVLASDSPAVVSPLLPSVVDKRPQSFFGDGKVLAPEQPKDPYAQTRPLLQRIAAMPQVVSDKYVVFSTDPASTQKANSYQDFLSALRPGAVIASDAPDTLKPLPSPSPDLSPGPLHLDGAVSCQTDNRVLARTDLTLRGSHTFWTWVRGSSLGFSVTKRDLNGYAGADPLTIEVFDAAGQSVGASTVPDDGEADASQKLGAAQKGTVSLSGLQPGPYRIAVKGPTEDWILGPIEADQDKLVVAGPVFLAGGAYTRSALDAMTLYLGLFSPAEPQVNLVHREYPQRVLIGASPAALTIDVSRQDQWVALGQKLDPGLWQVTSEKGDMFVGAKEGERYFSFTPCGWFEPTAVTVVDLAQGLSGAKPSASYVVITQPAMLQEPSPLYVDVDTSCQANTRVSARGDITLRGSHTFWTWVRGSTLGFSVTKRDLNGYAGADVLYIEVFNAAGQPIGSSTIPDDGDVAASQKLGLAQKGGVALAGLPAGPYRIVVKGAGEDWILGPIEADQDKLVVAGPVFLAGGVYTREPFKAMTLYLGLFSPAEPQANLVHMEYPQKVLIGASPDVRVLDVPAKQDQWIPLGQKLDSGLWQLTAEKGDLFIGTKEGERYFSFTSCGWFEPTGVSVVDLAQGLSGAKPSASYVVITQPTMLQEPSALYVDVDTSCQADTRVAARGDITLRGGHTFWTWVRESTLGFSVTKRDLNGYAGADGLSIEVFNAAGQPIGSSTIPDDGDAAASQKLGPAQKGGVSLVGLEAGAYRIAVKGPATDDWILGPIEADQDKLVVAGPVFLAGGAYTRSDLDAMTLYLGLFSRAEPQVNLVHRENPQRVLIGASPAALALDVSSQDQWVALGQKLEPGLWQMTAEKGDLFISAKEGERYFSFTPCGWFEPTGVSVVDLAQGLSGAEPAAHYVVVTQPSSLQEPPPAELRANTTPVSCSQDTRSVGRIDLQLKGSHTFWLWAEKGYYNLAVGKRNLNTDRAANQVSAVIYNQKGDQLLSSLLPDYATSSDSGQSPQPERVSVRLGPLEAGAYRMEVAGKGSFLIDFLETDMPGVVVQGKVTLGDTSEPGEPIRPVTLYQYSYKSGNITVQSQGAKGLQPILASTAKEQRTFSLDSGAKPAVVQTTTEELIAVTSLIGNVQLSTDGYFSFAPCSWFTPESVKLVALTRDPEKVAEVDFLLLSAADYTSPSTVKDEAGQWYESTVTWSRDSIFIPPSGAPNLDFVFSTRGGMLVDWVEIKLKVPPLWARFARANQ